MPRTSRSVAQRLAAQRSSKKRRPSRSGTPAPAPSAAPESAESAAVSVDQILDEVVPSSGGARTAATSALTSSQNRSPAAARRAGAGRTAVKPVAPRRRYSEYAAEYQYVWADLRRIVVVAGFLIALLIAASFFIQ